MITKPDESIGLNEIFLCNGDRSYLYLEEGRNLSLYNRPRTTEAKESVSLSDISIGDCLANSYSAAVKELKNHLETFKYSIERQHILRNETAEYA